MPLVRISLVKGKPEAYRRKVGDAVHRALVGTINVSAGRTLEQKRTLYRRIADTLHGAVGLRREDAWVNLVETAKENWSFGNGAASYAPAEAQTA